MTTTLPKPPHLAITPPQLPAKFRAVALLTPFNDSQLVVADIVYDWSVQAMRITTYGLESGYADLLYTPGCYYILDSENGAAPRRCVGPIATTEQVPRPNWLADTNVTFNGTQDVLGVSTNWWCSLTENKNGLAPIPKMDKCPPFESANWFWIRTDNQLPWRMMFINTTNDYKLPFIGRFAFVHFPTFEAVTSTDLPQIVQGCTASSKEIDAKTASILEIKKPQDSYNLLNASQFQSAAADRSRMLDKIQELIPGLAPPDDTPLPSWPTTLFMTALTTPTFETRDFPNQPYPTQIYYDWPNKRQLTRFFLPDDSLEDAILTGDKSYLVARFTDGTHKCLTTIPVGLPYPDWTTRDGGRCKGTITNNPQLSPNKRTGIYVLNSQPPRVFWIWYTTADEAIMFAEVPQSCNVELILTDYFEYMPNPPAFDPALFDVPPDCLKSPSSGEGKETSANDTSES